MSKIRNIPVKVRIVEVWKRVPNTNPLAGNAFDEVGDKPMYYEVRDSFGIVLGRPKTEDKALRMQKEQQAFYDKFVNNHREFGGEL